MIKKAVWTIILLIPIITGAISISGTDVGAINDLFNSSNVIESWYSFGHKIDITVNSDDINKVVPWLNIIFLLIVASFWTAPFWYAWKGTFLFGKIPVVGFTIRLAILLILLFIPAILSALSILGISGQIMGYISFTMSCILIGLALIGLWFRS